MSFSSDRPRAVRVLISDMSPLVSAGIEAILAGSPFFETHRCGLDRLLGGELEAAAAFDVVVIDGPSGLHLARQRQHRVIPAPVEAARIFLINPDGGERDIRRALEAGVHGCATLNLTVDEFQEGLRAVARGTRYVCPRSAQRLADSMTMEPLTPREAEVLGQLSLGSCNKTIALELEMAVGTVKAHVKSLMSKLGSSTRTQVVAVAIARGLVDPSPSIDRPATRRRRADEHRARVEQFSLSS